MILFYFSDDIPNEEKKWNYDFCAKTNKKKIDGIKKTCDICGKEFMKKPNRKIHNCNENKCE